MKITDTRVLASAYDNIATTLTTVEVFYKLKDNTNMKVSYKFALVGSNELNDDILDYFTITSETTGFMCRVPEKTKRYWIFLQDAIG